MPARIRGVIREEAARTTLPDWASEGAVLARKLVESERWKAMTQWLRVYRHVGYTATDVAAVFLLYFASGLKCGLKKFGEKSSPWRKQLAALVGRRKLPTPSSVSRLLGSATEKEVRPAGPRLLLEAPAAAALLKHPASGIRDAFGVRWDVFDSDATIQGIRERALPESEELPEPKRRVGPDLARPGYMGRKRGELRCSRGTLQHAGTGLWVGLALSAERADTAAVLPALLPSLDLACEMGRLARERTIVRADGAGGNVPWLTACRQHGTRYVTRWGHYSLLRQPDVQHLLAVGVWKPVPSSGSGPKREAMDLGEVVLRPGAQTRDVKGDVYEEIRSRMLVSRFKTEDAGTDIGQLDNGYVYELFAADLPADAWPCEETVALYFARAAVETRFAQEDHELGLDHLFSYNLLGQELACLFGLMVWNMRLAEGFAQHSPPEQLPEQRPRLLTKADPAPVPPEELSRPEVELPSASPAEEVVKSPGASPSLESETTFHAVLNELPWDFSLQQLGPGWTRALDGEGLLCPQGSFLHISSVRSSRPGGRPALRLLAPEAACRSCPNHVACTPSRAKVVTVPLTRAQGDSLRLFLDAKKLQARASSLLPTPSPSLVGPPRNPLVLFPLDRTLKPGPYLPSQERLVPSEFRQTFRNACSKLTLAIHVEGYESPRRAPILGFALTAEERQRARRSWVECLADNDLPDEVEVTISFLGPKTDLAKLGIRADETTKPRAATG